MLAGAFTFTVSANVLGAGTGSRQYTLFVSTGSPLNLSPLPRPGGVVGKFYANAAFQVGGGVPGYSWALQAGTNSDGLGLDASTGFLSGNPLSGGVFPITVIVRDASGAQVAASFNLNILGIGSTFLPDGAVGTPYSQTLTAAGGTGPFTWSLFSGALPTGLNVSAQGQITGTPTANGLFPFQIQLTDAATNLSTSKSFSINIPVSLTITTTSLPNGTVGTAYPAQTLTTTGGTPPYTWSATGLPAGVTLDSTTGVLSGTPTAAGTQTIAVTLIDATQRTASTRLGLTIDALTISTPSLPNGFVGIAYSAALAVTGNPAPLTWAVASGTLPAGLNISATSGVISGTPTAVGSSTFTISATLAAGTSSPVSVQKPFTVVISAAPSVTISGLPAAGVAATQPSATVALTGGTYPLNITGTMTLTFASAVGGDDQLVKFSNGTRTAAFTIAGGATQGLFGGASSVSVLTGTVAGTITITTSLRDSAGNSLTPPAPIVITISPTVPVITSVTIGTVTGTGFSISVTGRSTPRDMTSAKFHFTSPTNTQLASADVVVPLTSAFTAWYSNPASNAFGSLFTMAVQFSFTGPAGTTVPFTTVTVTLTNSKGDSNPSSPVSP